MRGTKGREEGILYGFFARAEVEHEAGLIGQSPRPPIRWREFTASFAPIAAWITGSPELASSRLTQYYLVIDGC